MSKQSEAKVKQGYRPKPRVCSSCVHYDSEKTSHRGVFGGEYTTEKNIRCALGDFAVKKMGTCDAWVEK